MFWQSFIGQENIQPYFERAHKSGKMHHAFIFSGPAQVGKRTFALTLAQNLNCLDPKTDINHECAQCQKIAHGNHPDVQLVSPDGAFIKIDQIRRLINDANLKPLEGKKKVYLITQADRLRTEAANALLKVLEEPSPQVLFILTTVKKFSLLPTIISRCLTINFTRVPAKRIEEYLMARQHVSAEEASQAALLADGRIGLAIDISQSEKGDERAMLMDLFFSVLNSSSYLTYYGLIDQLMNADSTEAVKERLALFSGILRDLILIEKGIDSRLLNPDQATRLAQLKGHYSHYTLMDLIYRFDSFSRLTGVNLNQKLYLENTLSRLWENKRRTA